MTGLTRRAFLQALGVTVAASAAPWGLFPALPVSAAALPALRGRLLEAVDLLDAVGRPLRRAFPDELVDIEAVEPGWYIVEGGRLPRAALQPVGSGENWLPPGAPGWVTVAAPYATARGWCAPDAPLIARLGWGAVAEAADALDMADGLWLGLRLPERAELAWSPAAAWTVAAVERVVGEAELVLNRAARSLTVRHESVMVWTSETALPLDLPAGRWPLTGRAPAGRGAQPGAPWEMDFGAWRLHGAYWHNRFGKPDYAAPAGVVETPVLAARALAALPVQSAVVL